MTTPASRLPEHKWQGTPLTPAGINGLSATEARVLALLAWHAATRTRATFTTVGEIVGDNGIALGAAAARSIVNDLHDQGYVLAANAWATIDATKSVQAEAERLTEAAVAIRKQAANRRAKEERQVQAGP